MQSLILLAWATICIGFASAQENTSTLEILHVIFRHGDRTPDSLYPNDPYSNAVFYPVGIGELTNPGKVTAYNIGVTLKKQYGQFLGDVYTPGLIEANSSPVSRCKASIQLVLAALFPPGEIQTWNENLKWQPIPYLYDPIEQNTIFLPSAICPNYGKFLQDNENAFESTGQFDEYEEITNYLYENSGYNASISTLYLLLHSTLKSEQEWGLALPPWTDSVWPEPLTTLAAMSWEMMVGTDRLRTLLGGQIMSKIINDTYAKINNNAIAKDRKIYFYSGHDINIATVLSWLGVFVPHSPPYGAHIIIEIHKISGIHIIKIFYQNYSTSSPVEIEIPGCGSQCPVDTFVQLYAPYFDAKNFCS